MGWVAWVANKEYIESLYNSNSACERGTSLCSDIMAQCLPSALATRVGQPLPPNQPTPTHQRRTSSRSSRELGAQQGLYHLWAGDVAAVLQALQRHACMETGQGHLLHKHTPIPPHPDGHACVMHAKINESTCQLPIFASAPSKHDGFDGRVAHVARLGCGRAGTGHHLKRVACAGSLPDSIPPLNSQHFINSLCHISTLYIPCAPSDPSPTGPKDAELLWRRGDGATMTD